MHFTLDCWSTLLLSICGQPGLFLSIHVAYWSVNFPTVRLGGALPKSRVTKGLSVPLYFRAISTGPLAS